MIKWNQLDVQLASWYRIGIFMLSLQVTEFTVQCCTLPCADAIYVGFQIAWGALFVQENNIWSCGL